MSADQAGFVDGVNVYRMCSGNPTSKLDPDGRDDSPPERSGFGFLSDPLANIAFRPFDQTFPNVGPQGDPIERRGISVEEVVDYGAGFGDELPVQAVEVGYFFWTAATDDPVILTDPLGVRTRSPLNRLRGGIGIADEVDVQSDAYAAGRATGIVASVVGMFRAPRAPVATAGSSASRRGVASNLDDLDTFIVTSDDLPGDSLAVRSNSSEAWIPDFDDVTRRADEILAPPTAHPSSTGELLADGSYVNQYDGNGGGVLAQLREDGFLEIAVQTGPGTPRGGDIFNEALAVFDPNLVVGVRGSWSGTGALRDNFDSFVRNLQSGTHVTLEEAAWNTFTGRMAFENGFTRLRIVQMNSQNVTIEFTR